MPGPGSLPTTLKPPERPENRATAGGRRCLQMGGSCYPPAATMTDSPTLRPSMALAAYAEPLIDARRVLICGDASSSLAEHMLSRGARSVHVCDTDAARVAEAATRNTSSSISFTTMNDGGFALRDGAFDVAVVENLASVGDVASVLKSIRRALTPRGAALIASANPDVDLPLLTTPNLPKISIDYYSLYDTVAEEFEHVRMLGQTPFVGYAIADFAPEADPLPALDTGFVPGGAEEPEWFIALASQTPVALDEFAVVQLPFRQSWPRARSGGDREKLDAVRASERRLKQKLSTLEAENQRLAKRASKQDELEQLERLKQELARRDTWIEELEARCRTADARADQAEGELEAEREKALDNQLPDRAQLEAKLAGLAKALESTEQKLAKADELASQREKELARLRVRESELEEQVDAGDPETQKELEALERQLQERGRELGRVSRDLTKLEQLSRNLVRELSELREGQPTSDDEQLSALRQKLDELAHENATREADLVALHWTVAVLEGKLQTASPKP